MKKISQTVKLITTGIALSTVISCATNDNYRYHDGHRPAYDREAALRERREQYFNHLDVSRDNRLSYSEFSTAQIGRQSQDPHGLFRRLDSNNDAYIGRAEFHTGMQALHNSSDNYNYNDYGNYDY